MNLILKKKLIIGLGNKDIKYVNTRHNVGFMFIESLNLDNFDNKFDNIILSNKNYKNNILYVKPQRYMNLSGECIKELINYYKINIEDIIIIFDDINIKLGKIRIKKNGSHGGHNGIRNIIENLKTKDFKRIKIGIGNPPNDFIKLEDWVLTLFNKEEKLILKSVFKKVENALDLILDEKIELACNNYNK